MVSHASDLFLLDLAPTSSRDYHLCDDALIIHCQNCALEVALNEVRGGFCFATKDLSCL